MSYLYRQISLQVQMLKSTSYKIRKQEVLIFRVSRQHFQC
jgi:hypothetical protein